MKKYLSYARVKYEVSEVIAKKKKKGLEAKSGKLNVLKAPSKGQKALLKVVIRCPARVKTNCGNYGGQQKFAYLS